MKMKLFLTAAIFAVGMVGGIQAQDLQGPVTIQQVLTYALAKSGAGPAGSRMEWPKGKSTLGNRNQ